MKWFRANNRHHWVSKGSKCPHTILEPIRSWLCKWGLLLGTRIRFANSINNPLGRWANANVLMVIMSRPEREAVGSHGHLYHMLRALEKNREISWSKIRMSSTPSPTQFHFTFQAWNGRQLAETGGRFIKGSNSPKKVWDDFLGVPHIFLPVCNRPKRTFLSKRMERFDLVSLESINDPRAFLRCFWSPLKSFDIPICASVQTSPENLLNITPNTHGKAKRRDGKFQLHRNFPGGWRGWHQRRAERLSPRATAKALWLFTHSCLSKAQMFPVLPTVAPQEADQLESWALNNIPVPKCHLSLCIAYHLNYLGLSSRVAQGLCNPRTLCGFNLFGSWTFFCESREFPYNHTHPSPYSGEGRGPFPESTPTRGFTCPRYPDFNFSWHS